MKEVLLSLALFCSAAANKTLFLDLGDKCQEGKEPWFCQFSSSCNALQQEGTKIPLNICSFDGLKTIVCCPPEHPNQNGTSSNAQSGGYKSEPSNNATEPSSYGKKAEEKCREYAEYVYRVVPSPILLPNSKKKKVAECAIAAETLIVGGEDAKANEFPHMALIGIGNNNTEIDWFCGGSLISPRFILTAAHCNISQHIGSVVVRLGALDIKNDKDKGIDLRVVEVFDFPDYNYSKAYHDISLLKLEKELELEPTIRPLCLHTSRSIAKEKAIASGWGYTSFDYLSGGYKSSKLQKVDLDLVSDEKCKSAYDFERIALSEGITPDKIFCAGGQEDKDACQGDSGGPLQIVLKEPYCMYSQIGVTAFGAGCGSGTPGGYTRVSHYVPWIESIVWP